MSSWDETVQETGRERRVTSPELNILLIED